MKKALALLLCATLGLGLLAGCNVSTDTGASSASSATSTAASSQSSNDVEEIVWMFWDDLNATEDLITIGYREILERFNKQYEGKYHVTPITTNLEEYDTKLNALVAAGQTPDVFICSPGPMLTQYVEAGIAANLTPYLTGEYKDWYADFSDGIFERLTYDGNVMAIPTNFAAACVYYNTAIFEEVGVTPPETYDEWLDVCAKIKAAGYTPISCSAGTAWCLSMIAGYLCDREGGPDNLAGVNGGTASWMDETFINAGYKLQEISQYFQASAAGDSNDQATAAFYNGEAAMLVQGSWAIGQINGSNPAFEDSCGVFRFPGIDGGADPNRMIVKTDNLVMSAKTTHTEAALALMQCFTDETAQKYTAEVGGKIPVTAVEIDYDKAPKQLAFIQEILAKTTGTFGFYNESLASVEAGSIFDDSMVGIFLGNLTPEKAFQQVEDHYKKNVWK